MTCKSGVSSLVSTTITNFRTYSQAIGTNWGQLDILRWSLLQMLYLVEYADYDSQTVLGSGVSDVSAQINSGGCDDLGMASGCLSDDSASAVIYRGVENPYGNIRQWLDGINLSSGQAYICYDRDSYASSQTSSPYTALGYTEATASGYIKTIGYDSSNPAIQRPTETRRKFFNIHSRLLLF